METGHLQSPSCQSSGLRKRGKVTPARRALEPLLRRIHHGSLLLVEGDNATHYGQPPGRGDITAVVNVHDPAAYRAVLLGGSVGAGEAYMEGLWSSPQLVDVIRLFVRNLHVLDDMRSASAWWKKLLLRAYHGLRRNTLDGSRRNIAAHYDLGNAFFSLFLDRQYMMYSANIFPTAGASLEQAAAFRLQRICDKLDLGPDDHLLEIGTGWGGLALYAAEHCGCRVTTTTISERQFRHAQDKVCSAGLADRVTVLKQDYRELQGQYDKLVSIEMIEAVGHDYLPDFFARCSALLKPDGLMLLQAITIADQRYEQARRAVDFIQRYIFPGGALPSLEVISRNVARVTDMGLVHLEEIGGHYARTLREWRQRFLAAGDAVEQMGFDERFQRMWEYYLCYCEGGFLERSIGTAQLLLAKPLHRGPLPERYRP